MTLVFETPYERRGVITPGLPVLAPGVERYPVSGGGSCSVQIEKDDEICVLDREGLQSVELVFFAPDGTSAAAMLGAKNCGAPTSLQKALSNGGSSAAKVLHALNTAGFDLGRAEVLIWDGRKRFVFLKTAQKPATWRFFMPLMTGC